MLKPQGYVSIVGDCRTPFAESDSVVCGHCNVVVFVKPGSASTVYRYPQLDGTVKEADGAFCRTCMKPVCLRCDRRGVCVPFMRRIEDMEERGRHWADAGIVS